MKGKPEVEDLAEKIEKMKLDSEEFTCIDCGGGFKSKGYLDQHREKKHGDVAKPLECHECNKILKSKRNLEDHIEKLHRTCKPCNLKFDNSDALQEHKKQHTSCRICCIDFKTKYKLERHQKTH